ncbi:MAG: TlpA family protein disulfide reductase [Chloroflexota bacterium]|nr:TlpA family protein disulfide reductase [Chloroflexota bacterium]
MFAHGPGRRRLLAPRNVLLYVTTVLLLIAVVLAVLTYLYDPANDGAGQRFDPPKQLATGDTAPPLQLRTLDGRAFGDAHLRGKPVWLSFWSISCEPCTAEIPARIALSEAARARGVASLAINVGDTPAEVTAYLRAAGYGALPVALDQQFLTAETYTAYYMPYHVFIGSDGVVRRAESSRMTAPQMREALDSLE